MIREVQLEEGLVEEYEKRFKEIYQQCKTRQAEARTVEILLHYTHYCVSFLLVLLSFFVQVCCPSFAEFFRARSG